MIPVSRTIAGELYCYACGPIDDFFGAFTEVELVGKIVSEILSRADKIHSAVLIQECCGGLVALRRRAEDAFKTLGWEGDHRSVKDTPAYFFVPDPASFGMCPGYVVKQDNNGSTFVASPVPLPYLESFAQCTG